MFVYINLQIEHMSQPNSFLLSYETVSGSFEQRMEDDKRKVWDNIHGFIEFEKPIWDFIDTPHFQRLRKIKQLSCLEYVFPGATNTRFEHSIGTAYLARKYIDTLIANNPSCYKESEIASARLTITLAGLLHDIGHGPYSHTFDSHIVTEIRRNPDGPPEKWTHETASEVLFDYLANFYGLKAKTGLSDEEVRRVKMLIQGRAEGERLWQFQIISNSENGIDVDKFDYFRRDAFYLGARNIYVDHDLLMSEARIIGNDICYPTKYVETVYNIFHCRYKLYKNYYNNPVNKGIEMMVCDVLRLVRDKFRFQEACEAIFTDPSQYIKLTDGVIEKVEDVYNDILTNPASPDAKHRHHFQRAVLLLRRIHQRKIYKFVKEFHYFIKESMSPSVTDKFRTDFQREQIHAHIAEQAGVDRGEVEVVISDIGFGLKTANPLKKVGFFRKEYGVRTKLEPEEVENLSMLFTNAYMERSVKVFVKVDDADKFQRVQTTFTAFCKRFNEDCQHELESVGLKLVIEGRGGRTPSVSHPQNTRGSRGRASNPFARLPPGEARDDQQ